VKTVEHRDVGPRRSHPWTTGVDDPSHRYCDFRKHPELIATELEDFRPWAGQAAVGAFYELVTWLNGPTSILESNDCAFDGPHPNVAAQYAKRLQCSGRLGVLFRDLWVNTRERKVQQWIRDVHVALGQLDHDLEWGVVGTSQVHVDYLHLPRGKRAGTQVLLWFWSWGDDEPEVFRNLARVIAALRGALETVSGQAGAPV
jgi:hypothetical protein